MTRTRGERIMSEDNKEYIESIVDALVEITIAECVAKLLAEIRSEFDR